MNKLGSASEDYLEIILNIIDENLEVRSVEIARRMGVSRASVNKAIGVLKENSLVNMKPYGEITLTNKGFAKASYIRYKHEIIQTFLADILKMDNNTANYDACKIEHVVSDEFIERLDYFLKNKEKTC